MLSHLSILVIAVAFVSYTHAACFHGDETVVTDRGVMTMRELAECGRHTIVCVYLIRPHVQVRTVCKCKHGIPYTKRESNLIARAGISLVCTIKHEYYELQQKCQQLQHCPERGSFHCPLSYMW
jgi:hypothetical protein